MKNLWITLIIIVVVAAIGTLVQGIRANMKIKETPEGEATVLTKQYFPFNGIYKGSLFAGNGTGRAKACERIGTGSDCIYGGLVVPCSECTKNNKPIV